ATGRSAKSTSSDAATRRTRFRGSWLDGSRDPQQGTPTGRTGYFTHKPGSIATAIRLIERRALRFSSRQDPPDRDLRHHQSGQEQLLNIEEDVQDPHRVTRDVAVEGAQQLAAEWAHELRDLVHQRRRE